MQTFLQKKSPQDNGHQNSYASLYIHIPFCKTKCPYCDFNTYAGIEQLIPSYIDALIKELRLWASALGPITINTVFFGGGTPSYLTSMHIEQLLRITNSLFTVPKDAEISLESNPNDICEDKLAEWIKAGINRLSIGVQSLDDNLLRVLGRRHSKKDAIEAFRNARQSGFENINIDLMYGLPYQKIEQWQETLHYALDLEPQHLSLYCLSIEKGTPFETSVQKGFIPTPDSDLAADMYELADKLVGESGFEQYEISNWAIPGYVCHHNINYWRNQSYLGVGPGAHSHMRGRRFANIDSPRAYIQKVKALDSSSFGSWNFESAIENGPIEFVEVIDERLDVAETIMLGLRLTDGIFSNDFTSRFGYDITDKFSGVIKELEQYGLLKHDTNRLYLTPRGRLLGNEVFERFLMYR